MSPFTSHLRRLRPRGWQCPSTKYSHGSHAQSAAPAGSREGWDFRIPDVSPSKKTVSLDRETLRSRPPQSLFQTVNNSVFLGPAGEAGSAATAPMISRFRHFRSTRLRSPLSAIAKHPPRLRNRRKSPRPNARRRAGAAGSRAGRIPKIPKPPTPLSDSRLALAVPAAISTRPVSAGQSLTLRLTMRAAAIRVWNRKGPDPEMRSPPPRALSEARCPNDGTAMFDHETEITRSPSPRGSPGTSGRPS